MKLTPRIVTGSYPSVALALLLQSSAVFAQPCPGGATLAQASKLTQSDGPGFDAIGAGNGISAFLPTGQCNVYSATAGGNIQVTPTGLVGNVIFDNGSLNIDGGKVIGYAAAGEFFNFPPTTTSGVFGKQGNIRVSGGGLLGAALIGADSSLTVGGPTPTDRAMLGWVSTSGTTLIQNADIDSTYAFDKGVGQRALLTVHAGTTTVTGSTLQSIDAPAMAGLVIETGAGTSGNTGVALVDPVVMVSDTTIKNVGIGILANQVTDVNAANPATSTLHINNSHIAATQRAALQVFSVASLQPLANTVTVKDSELTGIFGIDFQGTKRSIVFNADNTIITALGGTATSGVRIFGTADAIFNNHTIITGATDGIEFRRLGSQDAAPNGARFILSNNSSATGQTGAAIYFNGAVDAQVLVASGSTLTGGNGNIVQLDAGDGMVATDNVNLTGNVVARTGQLSLIQQNSSTINGNVLSRAGAAVTSTMQQATMTGDLSASDVGSKLNLIMGANSTLTGSLTSDTGGTLNASLGSSTALVSGGASAKSNGATTVTLANGARLSNSHGTAFAAESGSQLTVNIQDGARVLASNNNLVTVDGDAQAKVNVSSATVDTSLQGNMKILGGSNSKLDIDLQNPGSKAQPSMFGNVVATSMAVGKGAYWKFGADPVQRVGHMRMDNGTTDFDSSGGAYKTLLATTLSQGAGSSTFIMQTDFAQGIVKTDLLDVSGIVTGQHTLAISPAAGNDGLSLAQLTQAITVVHQGAGSTGTFALQQKMQVGVGAYNYNLEQVGSDQWQLQRSKEAEPNKDLSPAARVSLSLASTAPMVWQGETEILRIRQGDLRHNRVGGGIWARSFSNLNHIQDTKTPAFDMKQYGVAFGIDKRLTTDGGPFYVGGFGTYSYSTVDIGSASSGRVNSYGLGAYATWMLDNGWYVDSLLKANSFSNDIRIADVGSTAARGNYTMPGIGLSLELGKNIPLANNGYLEPYTRLAGFVAKSANDELTSGLRIKTGTTRSVQAELGMLAGQQYDIGKGRTLQPYMRAAVIHELIADNKVTLNGDQFTNDLSGTRALVGVGAAAQIQEKLQLNLNINYTQGKPVDGSWGFSLGARYVW